MAGTDDKLSIDPFDDSCWLSFEDVHRLLCQQLFGNPQVAVVDINEAFATKVPTMRRSRMYWADREILSFEYWNEHDLIWSDNRLVLVSCPPRPSYRIDIAEGFAGYAWLPKLAERWPTVFASTTVPAAPPSLPPDPETWLSPLQAEFDRLPRKQKSAWVRDTIFPRMQIELGDKAPWKSWESLKRAFYSDRRKKRKKI